MFGVLSYDCLFVEGCSGDLLVMINVDYVKGNYLDNVVFIGNVDINQGNSCFCVDEVQLYQQQVVGQVQLVCMVDVLGNVYYDDNQVIFKGLKVWLNLNIKDINVWQGDY